MLNSSSLQTLWWFWRSRRLQELSKHADRLERYKTARLNTFLAGPAADVAAFANFRARPMRNWPIMDKQVLMSDFERYNRLSLSAETGWEHLQNGTAPLGYAVGASTGTSGNRGLYIISNRERYLWLGVMLSKALPDVLKTRHRVAVILPANARLYDAANESRRLSLKFFDLSCGIDPLLPAVTQYDPTVIVAPPKVLRALAEIERAPTPLHIFSGAEVLDPIDRTIIEARFNLKVREIYMATEGLLGVACDHGTLHLAEDRVAFEWEPIGDGLLAAPLITDFSRRTQIMVRYRMNDLLERSNVPCPCGSKLQPITRIVGRLDDVFELTDAHNPSRTVRLTPDVIRNAVLGSDRTITDFRVIQTDADEVRIILPIGPETQRNAAEAGLSQLFENAGARPKITLHREKLIPAGNSKLRRVMRDFKA